MTGLTKSAGTVSVGQPATVVAVDGKGQLVGSIVDGKQVR